VTLTRGINLPRGYIRFDVKATLAVVLALCAACATLPRDPKRTLEEVQQRHRIRVGLVENPPWVIQNGPNPLGVEVSLIREFAESLGAQPEWSWLPEEHAMQKLEHFELEVVVGGIGAKTPWAKKVALTGPYHDAIVMAAPPGENGWLKRLETFLQQKRAMIPQLLLEHGGQR
jgi:polar amino acid transport system substrate-binding protein